MINRLDQKIAKDSPQLYLDVSLALSEINFIHKKMNHLRFTKNTCVKYLNF
jgi:hypothetical protein